MVEQTNLDGSDTTANSNGYIVRSLPPQRNQVPLTLVEVRCERPQTYGIIPYGDIYIIENTVEIPLMGFH